MTAAVPTSGDLWLRDAIGHAPAAELTKIDALAVTAKIKAYAGVAWILLWEAHQRKAHKALGYGTWAEYVETEFDMSRGRSYQLISQARVVMEISEAVSTDVDISEAMARDLVGSVDQAKAAVVEAVEALPADAPAEDKADAVQAALDSMRAAAVEARRPKASSGSDQSAQTDAAGPDVDQRETAPPAASPAPKVAPEPAVKMHARLSERRAEVAKWLAFDRHDQVIDAMSAEQRADYRSFVLSVFNHASATLDHLDAPARLKAVQ